MAEYFRDRGQHALIVVDDLTKHAASHREIALLTRQSPGREAYPGDVFYVHARLLERAAKLSKEKGGGSLTALPIAETDAGNLSAYIPTNLISITDGQIVLDAKLFHEGQKPAVDVGTSVSRVGGKTQARALRDAAKTLRLDYAQFLELEMFTRFGGMPDTRVRDQLTRGARIRAILDQPQHAPLRLADEVALVLAVQSGVLDALRCRRRRRIPRGLRERAGSGRRRCGPPDPGDRRRSTRPASKRFCERCSDYAPSASRRDVRAGGERAMTERLADISARIDGVRQLGARGQRDARHRRGARPAGAQPARRRRRLCRDDRQRDRTRPGASRRPRRTACGDPRAAGAGPVLRRTGLRRRLQRARARLRVGAELATSELFLIGTRRRLGRRRTGRRRRLEERHAVALAGRPQTRRPHRRSAVSPTSPTGEIDRLDIVFNQWRPGAGRRMSSAAVCFRSTWRFPDGRRGPCAAHSI